MLADRFPNFSICGLPLFISGETPDWRNLAHRNVEELTSTGLELVMDAHARKIDVSEQAVGRAKWHEASPLRPPDHRDWRGTGPARNRGPRADGVHVLHTMSDSFALREAVLAGARSAAIVGGGYIGLEMADAFTHRGLEVTLVEQLDQVMPTVDPSLADLLRQELQAHGVRVVTGVGVQAVEKSEAGLRVVGSAGFTAAAEIVLVVVGVRPATELAKAAGLEMGVRGAIRVDRQMRTSAANVLAAGDCVETWHRILGRTTCIPLGTTAHKQGRIAGENAVGRSEEFGGSLGTPVVKVFDLAVARTGLRDAEARDAGFDPVTVESEEWDHKAYYPNARRLRFRVTGDP